MPTSEMDNDSKETMVNEKHFVMCYLANGCRYIGIMDDNSIDNWLECDSKVILMSPKMYVEVQVSNSSQQIRPLIVPIHLAASKQKSVLFTPDAITMLEDLGVVDVTDDTCLESSEFYSMYKDAVSVWNARMSHVVAPTAVDIGRITGGKAFDGTINLR
jgi:hypothetical protein